MKFDLNLIIIQNVFLENCKALCTDLSLGLIFSLTTARSLLSYDATISRKGKGKLRLNLPSKAFAIHVHFKV